MNYETPELTVLTPAIDAVQGSSKSNPGTAEGGTANELPAAYADWE